MKIWELEIDGYEFEGQIVLDSVLVEIAGTFTVAFNSESDVNVCIDILEPANGLLESQLFILKDYIITHGDVDHWRSELVEALADNIRDAYVCD